jgi:hypothetical protein
LFAHGLLSMYNLTKSLAITDKPLRIFSVLCKYCRKTVTSQTELKHYDVIDITYYECMGLYFFLVNRQANRILSAPHYIAMYSFSGCIIFFNIISYKVRFLKKKLWNITLNIWFSLRRLSEMFLILRKIQRTIIINLHRSSCKLFVILVRLKESFILSPYFWQILKCEIA